MSREINSRDLDNYITGHYGEDQFRDEEPEEEIEDDSICTNGNDCDLPNCPEHGDDESNTPDPDDSTL
jgi:hypothetical protein